MAKSRKRDPNFEFFESCPSLLPQRKNGERFKETYVRLTSSLRHSPAYRDLGDRAKELYQDMLEEQHSSFLSRPKDEEPECGFWNIDFYFPRRYAFEKYGSCKSNPTSFKSDVESLASHGFIEIIRKGGRSGAGDCKRENAVYRLSAGWMEWKP